MGTLYIVATPIGNLKDITFRALEVLKEVDLVLAEDTRVTRKLLSHYNIQVSLKRYDEHVADRVHSEIGKRLQAGENIALVSDAGTPGVSDPGARLVAYVRGEMSNVNIVSIPGPSALIAALSVSGMDARQFTFLGYPPHKKGRKTFFEKLEAIEIRPLVFYESPHRLQKTLANLSEAFGANYEVIIAKELTKIHEGIFKGSISEAQSYFQGEKRKGEFVIIIL